MGLGGLEPRRATDYLEERKEAARERLRKYWKEVKSGGRTIKWDKT